MATRSIVICFLIGCLSISPAISQIIPPKPVAAVSQNAVGPAAAAPANDEQAGAITIAPTLPTQVRLDISMATANPSDPVHCTGQRDDKTVWFKFVPNYSGILVVDTAGSGFDTALSVYSGAPSFATQLACNDDFNSALESLVRVAVTSGQIYVIEVSSVPNPPGGNLVLNLQPGTNSAPALGSPAVTHSSGTGPTQMFTFAFNDPDGAFDITQANILINSGFNGVNACYVIYDLSQQTASLVSLVNDASTGSSKIKTGTTQTLENSQCIVYSSGSTAFLSSGTSWTLTLALAFKQSFAGTKNIFLYANSLGNLSTPGFSTPVGTWTVPAYSNQPPAAVSITPSTGTGQAQTFSFVFSDPNGFNDLTNTQVIFNSTLDANFSCTIIFDRMANAAFLLSDTATASFKMNFGSTLTGQNGQCSVNVGGAAFIGTGNTLTISGITVSFKQPFTGTKNAFLYAQDIAGQNSGLPALGSWTVPGFTNMAPSAESASPNGGTGSTQTFNFTFSDANGYADITSPEVIINSSLDARSACAFVFDRRSNSILLINDASNGSAPVRLQTLDTAQNSQCVIYGSASSVTDGGFTGPGTNLTVTVAIAFKPAFAGTKNIYMVTSDTGGLSSGIQLRATWGVPAFTNQAPAAVSVSPNSGGGQSGTFTVNFSDPNGFNDLILPEVIFNQYADGRNACLVVYDRFSDLFYLVNDSSTGSTKVRAGSLDVAENGQCSLTGSSYAVGSGNALAISLALTFKQSFGGPKNIFLYSQDVAGLNTGLPNMGTFVIPAFTNQAPANVSVTPASGSGSSQLFRLTFTDANGYGDLVNPEFLMNSGLDARNACVITLDKLNGAVLLLNDAATSSASVLLNSSQTAQNSQCTLLGQGSLALGSGNDLVLQLNLVFKSAFGGAKSIYMLTNDQAGQSTGFQMKGTYTVQ